MLYCIRFHKRDSRSCSPGRWCRSVQGGITIFSHAACCGNAEREGGRTIPARCREAKQPAAERSSQGQRANPFFSAKFTTHVLLTALWLLWGSLVNLSQLLVNNYKTVFICPLVSCLLSYSSFVMCQNFWDVVLVDIGFTWCWMDQPVIYLFLNSWT